MVKKFLNIILFCFLLLLCIPGYSYLSDNNLSKAPSCYSDIYVRNITEYCKDSFRTVIDVSKLLISISTGIFFLAPTIFSLLKVEKVKLKWLIIISFVLLSISVFLGVNVIYSIAGRQRWNEYDILENYIGMQSLFQLLTFTVGAICIGFSFLSNAFVRKEKPYIDEIKIGLALAEVYKLKGDYDEALKILDDISKD